jgi:hypothetical protein
VWVERRAAVMVAKKAASKAEYLVVLCRYGNEELGY